MGLRSGDLELRVAEQRWRGATAPTNSVAAARHARGACVTSWQVIRKDLLFTKGDLSVSQAITEKQVLQQMASRPHPYVVSLRYAFQSSDNIFLVMDLVGGGDLYQLLQANGRLPEKWVVVYAAEVALALEHVHSHDVIFRDLKPENVMIGVDGHLKLTDFGLSKQLEDEDGGVMLSHAKTICGTPEYIAPEVLQGKPYSSAIDWWAYGCLVYEMVHGAAPFVSLDMGSLVQLITRCKIKFRAEFCSGVLESLLRKFITNNAESRLGADFSAIAAHAFFAGLDWDALKRKEVRAHPVRWRRATLSHGRRRGRCRRCRRKTANATTLTHARAARASRVRTGGGAVCAL
jgi:serine/threonine protein kinase